MVDIFGISNSVLLNNFVLAVLVIVRYRLVVRMISMT